MGILLFMSKPLLYLVVLAIAAAMTRRYAPHGSWPTWAVVLVGTGARLGLGIPTGFLAIALGGDSLVRSGVIIFVAGLVSWFATLYFAFRKTPPAQLAAFAFAADLMSTSVDVLAWNEVQSIHFC